MSCELCEHPGGELLWQDRRCRVVRIAEPGYPGYCRVIWDVHVREMTDLDDASRSHLLHVTVTVESVLRRLLRPDKINLASFGNAVPHLHWHVIARFIGDPHFPESPWGSRQREPATDLPVLTSEAIARALRAALP